MAVCNDKVCDAVLCEECKLNPIPKICGKSMIAIPTMKCGAIIFVGLTDLVVKQGEAVDLVSGVHAYDGDGHEVTFTYTSVDTNVLGEHIVTYTAVGAGDAFLPSMCGRNALHITDCGNYIAKAYRTVTVEATEAVTCTSKTCESLTAC